jgi:hypothetical protein
VTVVWQAPPVVLRVEDGATAVTAPGYRTTATPGAPRLPFTTTLIALPPGVTPQLRVTYDALTRRPLGEPLPVAPQAAGVLRDEAGRPTGGALAPWTGDPLPARRRHVTLEDLGRARGVRLARLTLYPALPQGDQLQVVRGARVTVRWPKTPTAGRALDAPLDDALTDRVRRQVLNPEGMVVQPPLCLERSGPASGAPSAMLEVAEEGLYQVTYADLEALGLTAGDPAHLRLFRGDQEAALHWQGDGDAAFEPGEALRFYAEPRFSRWTGRDVYRLVADATPGLRMASRSADPTGRPAGIPWVTQVWEENLLYTPDRFAGHLPAGRDGDRWMWAYLLTAPNQASATQAAYPFTLSALDATQPATLTLWTLGYTTGAHRWDVHVNGAAVGAATWTGQRAVTTTLTLPPGTLVAGENTLLVSLPEVEGAWLDAFAVEYARNTAPSGTQVRFGRAAPQSPPPAGQPGGLSPRAYLPLVLHGFPSTETARAYTVALEGTDALAYDVSTPLRPQILTDVQVTGQQVTVGDPAGEGSRRYFVSAASSVSAPAQIRAQAPLMEPAGADYLVIAPAALAPALDPLLALRQAEGLATFVADVQAVYDGWGDGRMDPAAIRAFIAHAYAGWTPRPTYVLLVGDGSFDPRRYRTSSPATLLPPYLADVDPWAGETAADNRYACVDGDDRLPDVLLGRLPVDSPAEAEALVEKIVTYATDPYPGGWNATTTLVADDQDSAGDFGAASEAHAATYVSAPFTVTRHYCAGTNPHVSDCPAGESASLRAALVEDWDRGALLVQFTGHSSWQQWAVERLLHLDDAETLENGRRLPVVLEMTCFTGAFHRPEPTLDETLVTVYNGGAVAAWGPTGLGVGTGHDHLTRGFFRATFVDEVDTLGQATFEGKLLLAASGQNLDLLDTFGLLGDPAQGLNRTLVPWARRVFLPAVASD